MAKIRGIKPDTWTDAKFVRLTPLARLLFIGMWNLACDNGHVEDDAVQLKIRLLPIDNADIDTLVDEMVTTGQVERHDGFLKVVKLADHQHIDLFWLTLCEHCPDDPNAVFTEADKKRKDRNKKGARQTPEGRKSGTSLAQDGDGDVDMRGDELRGEETRPTTALAVATPPRDDVNRICQHLANRIEANTGKRPAIGKRWYDAARLLIDNDGRTEQDIHAAIDWCQDDEFWRANILSLPKLREKYDQLQLQAQRRRRGNRQDETDALFARAALRMGVTQ